jgi:hypothetical protein
MEECMSAPLESAPPRVWFASAIVALGFFSLLAWASDWMRSALPAAPVQAAIRVKCPAITEHEMLLFTVTREGDEYELRCGIVSARGTYTRLRAR